MPLPDLLKRDLKLIFRRISEFRKKLQQNNQAQD
jgi:hypothetical protein